ncbi:MAG TPA: hypothetical protein PKH58_06600 [Paludibacteraceae bacterium]|nr:hypothetical protein [Paludibacteraceae bacterium]
MKRLNYIILLISLLFTFTGCTKKSRFEINTSKEKVDVTIHRFDKDLINLDISKLNQSVDALYKTYSSFLPLYIYNVLDTLPEDTLAVAGMMKQFVQDTSFISVNKKVMETFSDISDIEKDISGGFTYIHHYFPKLPLPEVYFFVSGFNRSVLMTDSILGVGTDFYLGADYEPYKSFTYDYLLQNMRRESLAIDVVSATLFRYFSFDGTNNALIDNMLHRGKVIYLLSVFMPGKKMNDIIGYTTEQWKWAEQYEEEIWKTVVGKKHLFSTDMQLISKYMNDAPFTSLVSQDSPGRLGTWIGWRIIKSYMERNENVTLEQLMKENNYRKILEQSHYKP